VFINCVGQTIREQFDVTCNYVESGCECLACLGKAAKRHQYTVRNTAA